jgi:hypothetical protein
MASDMIGRACEKTARVQARVAWKVQGSKFNVQSSYSSFYLFFNHGMSNVEP